MTFRARALEVARARVHGQEERAQLREPWHRNLRWACTRCVYWHILERDGPFRSRLMSLRYMLKAALSGPAFGDAMRVMARGIPLMDKRSIKQLSYRGAVLAPTRGGHRYTDPGNFVYAVFRYALGCLAPGEVGAAPETSRSERRDFATGQALQFRWLEERVGERWPKGPDSRQWCECVGDMLEMAISA